MLSKKSKIIALVASIGSVAALSGVGYAAWVITANASESTTGTITVDTVTDNRLGVTIANTSGFENKIVYGHPSSATTGWLTNTDANTVEALAFSFDITVTNYSALGILTAKFTADGGTNTTGYAAAVTAGYVAALPTISITLSDFTADGAGTVSGVFAWGTHFDSSNPYTYYNDKSISGILTGTTTYGDDANTSLGALNTDLANVSYKLTVTANVA